MMLITTSRKPGQLTRAIARTLADALGAGYLNRGKSGIQAVFEEADKAGADQVLFVWERFGNPSRLVGFDMNKARAMETAENQDRPNGEDEDSENGQGNAKTEEKSGNVATQSKKKAIIRPGAKDETDKQGEPGQEAEPEQTPWMKPEVGIHGVVFHRRSIRRKGAKITPEDPFGERVAALLEAAEGPNQIVLSRFGLKVIIDSELVLELKFRT